MSAPRFICILFGGAPEESLMLLRTTHCHESLGKKTKTKTTTTKKDEEDDEDTHSSTRPGTELNWNDRGCISYMIKITAGKHHLR